MFPPYTSKSGCSLGSVLIRFNEEDPNLKPNPSPDLDPALDPIRLSLALDILKDVTKDYYCM